MSGTAEFIDLVNHDDYEILNVFPYTIRRKDNHYVPKESFDTSGYIQVYLKDKLYLKHRLIAEQFIENPLNLPFVDHKNKIRTDNHIENLRWVTIAENSKNKSSQKGVIYTYVDDIDENSIVVSDYGKHEFDEYYYDPTVDKFFFWNGINYRELYINEDKRSGSKFVVMKSTENKTVNVFYAKFKKLYGLK